ncbi:MAG: hypothetical protein ACI31R_00365 [Bacilli bacterium]
MNTDNVFCNDFLNHKFNKNDIYKAHLCKLSVSEGYLQVVAIREVVGVLKDDMFFDFNDGSVWDLLEINEETKYNSQGNYVVSPVKVYDKSGRVRPIDVLCDVDNKKEENEQVKNKGKVLRRVFSRK